ncbi:glycosyltransferase family 2 protein [Photobacterium damselae]|uniref:glycosyltransferase family 2 protein n=1 Tax=Photobacterium damselae TaxID=38293 RepID=UPI003D7EEDE0
MLTIVTIVYNDVQNIERTIKSVLINKTTDVKYVIVDGGSTDGTVDIINRYLSNIDTFISEKDSGIYDAMNKGWHNANNDDYVIFVNSGDFLFDNAVSEFKKTISSSKSEIDIYHGLISFFEDNSFKYIQGRSSSNLEKKMIEHPSCFVKKYVFDKLGGFDLTYKCASDYDFMLRAKQSGYKFMFMNIFVSNFDLSGASSNGITGYLESLKIKKKLGIMSLKEFYLRYAQAKVTYAIKMALK